MSAATLLATGGTPTKIQWEEKLLEAANKLDAASEAATVAKVINTKLKALRAKADKLYSHLALTKPPIASQEILTPANKDQANKISKDCEAIVIPEECSLKSECEWNDKATEGEKKCKLNTTKVRKAKTQAGETKGNEQTATEKCTGKVKDVCKKEAGCKWEENKCKDSSILLNKKLALSMAAGFMSLV
ncbi:variant surface glycoprotein VSG [Trypanosoma brucei equiperdum]|uniref:Variant surface glycoprotein VSG n=1 Tax=Trypanosoma brucei equiperdum TaxID=630700 RepID=A0A3L6KQC5_9TRYP|nr:variant surface glycoprotein VSG [Trypanosoma brucei equiperdum]RHW66859.1 variant surface glycoprotein VSG [Trypanosoma brucei equiperdum]RHW66864.1 variant surface glycoprotein VSG [Trypanosoma brucei equiperdum]RHW66900.1 variant surface glycoprotein VSG [Trypanosoma brucei equiperdum]RHW66903.1 variant surface glycoprotein VSG [Trypanosoma brucei equiperdum]